MTADRAAGASRHPIGAVTQRTGLSAHTLRAWERRYETVKPTRTEGGHRLYSDADVERLRVLHELTLAGRQIGQIADLTMAELRELLAEDRAAAATAPGTPVEENRGRAEVGPLLAAAFDAVGTMDAEGLDRVLRRSALTLSTASFLDDLLVPLMGRIGDAWAGDQLRPAHEHVASTVTTRVTGWLMDAFRPVDDGAPCLVVATPSGARHELGALWAAVTGASEGWRIRHLGADLPADDIALSARNSGARVVALSLVFPEGDSHIEGELRRLRHELGDGFPIVIGGRAVPSYQQVLDEIGATQLPDFRALRTVLQRIDRAG